MAPTLVVASVVCVCATDGNPHSVLMYVCMYACMHACTPGCMHVCMYMCMRSCVYVINGAGRVITQFNTVIGTCANCCRTNTCSHTPCSKTRYNTLKHMANRVPHPAHTPPPPPHTHQLCIGGVIM